MGLLIVLSNFMGGLIVNLFLGPKTSLAKETEQGSKTIISQEFILINKEGRHIARLGVGPDGSAAIQFFDESYTPRATLGVLSDGAPALNLYDKDRKLLLELGSTPEKYLGLAVFDMENFYKHKNTRVWFGFTDDDLPTLAFFKEDGQVSVGIGRLPDGSSAISFPRAGGKGGVLLYSQALKFQDEEGQVISSMP